MKTYKRLKQLWDKKGTFTYKGLTWKKGINDNGGEEILKLLRIEVQSNAN